MADICNITCIIMYMYFCTKVRVASNYIVQSHTCGIQNKLFTLSVPKGTFIVQLSSSSHNILINYYTISRIHEGHREGVPVVDTAAFPSLPLTGCGLFSQPAHRQEQLGTVVQSQLIRLRPTEEHKEECERGKGLTSV